MKAVYIKELRSYFTNVTAYACFALIFLITGIYTWAYNIQGESGSFESTISGMAFWVFVLPIPLLTMRIFSEERKQKTDQLLYSLPLKTTQIVFGKYLAAITVLLIPILIIGLYPLLFSAFGTVNFATCYSTLFGFYLMGAAFTAVGVFVSSLVENQIVSAVITAIIIFFNYYMPYIASYVSQTAVASTVFLVVIGTALGLIVFFMTKNSVAGLLTAAVLDFGMILFYYISPDTLEGFMPNLLGMLSLFDALDVFAGGIFDLTGVIFFLSVAGVCMFLTVQSLEKRRWA
ncbi:MAG: ABC transporter permease [Clostridiales bacterium]|nr:ABC transporter permease [Clostridiales bacterium]